MSDKSVNLERLAQLIRLVESRGLAKLIVEENGCRYEIRGCGNAAVVLPETTDAPEGPDEDDLSKDDSRVAVVAPMVGVFYRSPAPNERPYVEIGDRVEVGQTIGMIEAMKVFSEIPSETAGIVDEIAADDGDLVKPGQPLLYLRAIRPEDEEDAGHD